MFQSMPALIFGFGLVGTMLLGINFAIGPTKEDRPMVEAIFTFIAFFFLLLGLKVMFFSFGDLGLIGDLFASLALTFLWLMLRRRPD
jgi:hypothetical protein